MAKGTRKGSIDDPIKTQDLQNIITGTVEKEFIILSATIKDDFCDYTYEVLKGTGKGMKHKCEGKTCIVDADMHQAFGKFIVHLACIDDAFKHSGIEITDIDNMETHEITQFYHVSGFKMVGSEDSPAIKLTGSKHVSAGGRISLETPKIHLDNLTSYKWYNELLAAADAAIREVELYKAGKYTIVKNSEDEDSENTAKKKSKFKQSKIFDINSKEETDDAEHDGEEMEPGDSEEQTNYNGNLPHDHPLVTDPQLIAILPGELSPGVPDTDFENVEIK